MPPIEAGNGEWPKNVCIWMSKFIEKDQVK